LRKFRRRDRRGRRLLNANVSSTLAFPEGAPKKYGTYDAASWKRFIDALDDGGQLANKNIDPDVLYTTVSVR